MSLDTPSGSEGSRLERVIRPKQGLVPIDFAELWRFRELLWFLALREVLVHYKQTSLGILWVLIQPLFTMVVFTYVFGKMAGFAKDSDTPYTLITLTGIVAWQFFSNAMSKSSQSVVSQQGLITKVYFPRLIVPTTYVISAAVDFAIAMLILFALLIVYQVTPTPCILLLPAFILVAAMAAFGVGLWLSALNVKYRDIKFLIPFIVQLGFFISPVGFLSSKIGVEHQFLYSLNPMVGVIDGFRWCLLGPAFEPYWPGFCVSVGAVVVILVAGAYFFRYAEKSFADVV